MDAKQTARVIQAVEERRDEVLRFLQKLIGINSETGHEAEIQAFIAGTLREMDLQVDMFEPDTAAISAHPAFLPPSIPLAGRPNVVGIYNGAGGGRSLLLNGHVDTVPIEPAGQWLDGPFSGKFKEGLVYGRGASDMKSGVAAMTMAMRILFDLRLRPKGNVILEYTVDEEHTGIGTLACVLKGYIADAGICCETSNLEVMPACIGRMWFTIELEGKPSGISSRWESVSAIDKGIKIVQAVDDLEKMRIQDLTHPLFPDNRGALPCAVTMFHSGSYPSMTPDAAVLKGSFGMMPYEDPKHVQAQLVAQIERTAKSDPWLRDHMPKISFDGLTAAGAEIPADHPIVRTVAMGFEQATGAPARIGARKGGADTRFLIRYGNTPTVIFGPGLTPQMHAMNEYVPLENVIVATKVLCLAILEWCDQA